MTNKEQEPELTYYDFRGECEITYYFIPLTLYFSKETNND